MDLSILLTLAENNSVDIKAIVAVIGPKLNVQEILDLTPHIVAILKTLQAPQSPAK